MMSFMHHCHYLFIMNDEVVSLSLYGICKKIIKLCMAFITPPRDLPIDLMMMFYFIIREGLRPKEFQKKALKSFVK